MRHRTKQNPLLVWVLGASILLHLIALPILARYGTFQKVTDTILVTQMVSLPPPEPQPKQEVKPKPKPTPPPPLKKQPIPKRAPEIRKTTPVPTPHEPAPRAHAPQPHPAVNQPRLIAQTPTHTGPDHAPAVPQGSGDAGRLPTGTGTPLPAPPGSPIVAPTPELTPVPTPTPTPEPTPSPTPKPTPVPTPTPAPVFTQPVAIRSPDPDVPDSLRQDALDKSTTVVISIGPDGVPTSVTVAVSSGNRELDRIAVDTAKRWRFKPGTRDGQPIASKMRLQIEFQVS